MKMNVKIGLVILFLWVSNFVYTLLEIPGKIMFWYCMIFGALPILMFYVKAVTAEYSKQSNRLKAETTKLKEKEYYNSTNQVDNNSGYTNTEKKFIPKVIENENYTMLRELFHDLIQNSQLTNNQIVSFLGVIDNRLGSKAYNYKYFNFQNNAHEIYTKLKSSKFNDEDYRRLYNELIRIKNGLEEIDADYFKEAKSD